MSIQRTRKRKELKSISERLSSCEVGLVFLQSANGKIEQAVIGNADAAGKLDASKVERFALQIASILVWSEQQEKPANIVEAICKRITDYVQVAKNAPPTPQEPEKTDN